ncbi:putative uncharacterized alpha/beta hydrolase domain (DUF2235) [Lyophyllum shimeji]|uniref:Uncharacterized alpha/beta hydrolase domain (DUF2235) n=1 Tax=Lyophyllum shimeji TaxID=47721 RepID=A0A9P3UT01_LYOSH|nr:putative uncharacterized alpha/beta hydrolase domain (DUF2235) [Lyophyllum shimeji]
MPSSQESKPSINKKGLSIDSPAAFDQYPGFTKTTSPGGESSTGSFDDDDIIPPTHHHRTLVLCFDGTGDQFDEDNSNIVNFFSMLKKDNPREQLVYYQAGIGTYTIPQIAKPTMAKFHRIVDAMIGKHLNAHVMGGYEFLMQNYEAGDKICIFGFSRGAYTARALAGMIHKIGLLPKCNHQQVPFAYKMYSREDDLGWRQSTAFKKAFSIDVDIELLGLWETVGSVGMIPKRLPFTTSNNHVKYFRHALALDEHRVRFKPNFWNRPTPEDVQRGIPKGYMPRPKPKPKTTRDFERQYSHGGEYTTDIEEVWFAGCHCDVGGGAVRNEIRNSLARIPLRWMVRQCFILNTGILFHREMFKVIGMDPDCLYPIVRPRPPVVTALSVPHEKEVKYLENVGTSRTLVDVSDFVSEEEEDLADALCPINDMLDIAKSWWILEYLPQKIKYQGDDDAWVKEFLINRGQGRIIPKQHEGVKVHRTVKLRMEHANLTYRPKAQWSVEPIWVD